MTPVVLLSPSPGSGKTTVAVALAQKFRAQGRTCSLIRQGGDRGASSDAALFSRFSAGDDADVSITEAPGGDPSAAPRARAVVIADAATDPSAVAAFCSDVGPRLAGLVLNRVPVKRSESAIGALEAVGVKVLLSLPEDRLLATPTLGRVADALNAQSMFFDPNCEHALEGLVIASIGADPGQDYFRRQDASAVIVRSDKPDLQLAAINAGASCLIVTGGLPFLSYVTDRAKADEIPLIRTRMDTVETVTTIEGLYAAEPFSGGPDKLSRLALLTDGFDPTPLLVAG